MSELELTNDLHLKLRDEITLFVRTEAFSSEHNFNYTSRWFTNQHRTGKHNNTPACIIIIPFPRVYNPSHHNHLPYNA